MDRPSFPTPPPRKPGRKPIGGWFPTPAFRDAGEDLKHVFSGMGRRQWLFLGLSAAITFAVLWGFLHDSDWRTLGVGPRVIYVENWRADRSDAEIRAQQLRDQRIREQQQQARQEQFQKLEKRLGI